MNIEFQKMIIDNFMSFEHEEFDFSGQEGITLITGINHDIKGGKNGCGKSALINALVFALFGRMLNQMKLSNVSNRFIPVKKTQVILYFKINDKPYVIDSGIKSGSGYCKLYKEKIDPKTDISLHSVGETRNFIEKELIGSSYDVFIRSYILTSDQFYNYFKMSKQDKKTFDENIFDLKVYGEMYRLVHKDYLANERELSPIDALVASYRNDIMDMEEKQKNLKDNLQGDIDRINEEISQLIVSINQRNEILFKYDRDKLCGVEKKLKQALGKLQEYVRDVESRKRQTQTELNGKQSTLKSLKSQYTEKVEYMKTYTETYKQLSDHSKPIVTKKLGLDKVKESVESIKKQMIDVNSDIKTLETSLGGCVVPDEYKHKINKINDDIIKVDTTIKKIDKIRNEINTLNVRMESKKSEVERMINNPDSITDLLEKKKKDFETNSEKLNELIKYKNLYTFIEKVVGEETIKKLIIADLVKMLNSQVQRYLTTMGSDFTCVFDKDMKYTFLTKNGETEYNSFSSGEKMRLSIATSFAFRDFIVNRSGINSNVLMLDEYMDSNIDDLAVREIFKILREFNIMYNQNIFVVSHREAVKMNAFDDVISVDKQNGISRINRSTNG